MAPRFATQVANAQGRELQASSDATTWRHLLRAFDAAVDEPTGSAMFELRSAASEFAAMARRENLPPERAVIALKALLVGHGATGWRPSLDSDGKNGRAESIVYTGLFAWFVTAYYDVQPLELVSVIDR